MGPLLLIARWQKAPSLTLDYLARPSPLHLNSVAGELFGLVPALRRAHVDLQLWLARDHPSNLCVEPDILRTEWDGAGARDARPLPSIFNMNSVS